MTDEKWHEMQELADRFQCAVCGRNLTVHTNAAAAAIEVGCAGTDHSGWLPKETRALAMRRRGELEGFPQDIGRQMNMLAVRYPDAIVDKPTAALFIIDCVRLGLDPLMQPAEAVPVPFRKSGAGGKKLVAMIVTVDGWYSMAARGCPEKWAGGPSVEPVFDERIAESLCGDKKAWVYKATGSSRQSDGSLSAPSSAYGCFTTAEHKRAVTNRLPAGDNPGNQAAVRARKHWIRENFPDCRQRMAELTAEWRARAEGVIEAQDFIDAEYRVLDEKEPRQGESRITGTKAQVKKTGKERAKNPEGKLDASPAEDEKGRGGTEAAHFHEANTKPENKKSERAAGGASPSIENAGGGANLAGCIDIDWLKECLQRLKWNDTTCITFIASQFKVDKDGSLFDVVARLSYEQAGKFCPAIQKKVDELARRQPPLL